MSLIEQALDKMRVAHRDAQTRPVQVSTAAVAPPASMVERQPPAAAAGPHARQVTIDESVLVTAGVIADPEKRHQQASEYRAIKRQLLQRLRTPAEDGSATNRLLMVASAVPGEGKTFNAINLAFALARERDFQVLLVDADVAKPNISRLFGIHGFPGLLDAAHDESLQIEDLIIDTNIPGFSLLPAGAFTANATEFLSSLRMQALLQHLVALENRLVVIDSPPLLMTTESAALSQLVGQVLLVVKAGSTPKRAVMDALELLGNRAGLSLVLNQIEHMPIKGYYYGYGYNYGDSQGGHNG